MIITKIQGGLGNQMFQYAYGRSLSYKYNTDFYLDISFYKNQFSETIREFELDKFSNTYTYVNIPVLNNYHIHRIQDSFSYQEHLVSSYTHYYLDGYWQSEKYFKINSDIIRNDFSPSNDMISKLNKKPLIDTNTVSMHIRRTDYVKSNGYHPVQDIEYYKKALDIIGEYDYIFVFSDDMQWCKDNLPFNNMVFMSDFSNLEDLYLMSMCKNNIIANSSFSWWGAWLNNNPNKKVIAPNKWFGEKTGIDESDIIPETWIKI
jgi:Glycosyl transferase family 11